MQRTMVQGIEVVEVHQSLLVLNKPEGMLAVPGRGEHMQDCLSSRIQAEWPEALVVHRLDMATSGLMVLARGPDAQRALSQAFARRLVRKRYEAVVWGRLLPQACPPSPDADDGWQTIDLPLLVDWPNRPRSIVSTDLGKPSRTRWRVLRHHSAPDTTRVELMPVTGRSHQLRVHLQALGHPILGDALYASPEGLAASGRLLLHATDLALPCPETGRTLQFQCQPPF